MVSPRVVLLLVVGLLGLASAASAATIHVANNGLDSPTCGAAATPCRSISQALVMAGAEPEGRRVPRILVGPGRYGDLDGDGALTGAGEEFSGLGTACSCMILVARPVEIESTHGAAVTVLVGIGGLTNVVQIESSHVQFGREKKGFTVMRGASGLFAPGGLSLPLSHVSVAGNLAVRNDFEGLSLRSVDASLLQGNIAIGSENGLAVTDAPGARVQQNIAIANTHVGIGLFGPLVGGIVTKNVASAGDRNGFFHTFGEAPVLFLGNVAVGNDEGFTVAPTVPALASRTFTGNSAIGHVGPGFVMAIGENVQRNNTYGNGVADPPLPPLSPNCGLLTGGSVFAPNNFWGASTGPGPDPADLVCDQTTATTFTPFAGTRFPITTPNLW